ncbi:MAG: formate dehydrogenase accessory sulfurtransferase FdhD [Bacteroidales bacterium]
MKKVNIRRIENGKRKQKEDHVIKEVTLKVVINGKETLILPCSGNYVNEMITGYLYTNGYISTPGDIRSLDYHMESRTASVSLEKSKNLMDGFVDSAGIELSSSQILEFMDTFSGLSEQFRMTGAVHTAAMATRQEITKYFDDIGRHNALDKLIGYGMTNNEPFSDKCLLLTCRISQSIISKVIKAGFPMVVSTSPPTDKALEMAKENNIAMAGFARGKRMNIYHDEASFL